MNKAIEITNYTFQYEGTEMEVLKGCSFTLRYGEFVLLSGDSGAGKSTLLASIIGSIPHIMPGKQSGKIRVAGQDISRLRISEISRFVGSVLQDADSQIVHAQVEDEIAFGCENIGLAPAEIEKRIDSACAMMKLQRTWRTSTLSGGQKQRLITAAALAMGRRILVFDEPLANLDRQGAQLLMQMLKGLTHEGYAVLFVEHRLDMAAPYADRIVWMDGGRCENTDIGTCRRHMTAMEGNSGKTTSERCIKISDLAFSVPGREIFKDISLTIGKGERMLVLGENGCGKTTLLRMIARLQKPSSGEVIQYIDTSLGKKPSPRWFKRVGYVYQNPNYQLFMPTVREEIGYQSQSDSHTAKYMDLFGLTALAERHPHSLSEGQKRKLSIAAIAALEPDLLLLDEPTVGQDYAGLQCVVDTLGRMNRELRTTIITVTHDYRCAGVLADRVMWIKDGRLYKLGGREFIEEYFVGCKTIRDK